MSPKMIEYLAKQAKYIKDIRKHKNPFSWVSTGEFLLSMRQFGYQNTFAALAEFIDNAIEALATEIVIVIKTVGRNDLFKVSHPGAIAVCDNGKGMEPDMIRAALRWGGTHRFEDRNGMGRFGIGLPGAAGSLSKTYSVYSSLKKDDWQQISVDLIALANSSHKGEEVLVPEPKSDTLPKWVRFSPSVKAFDSGTVVLVDNPDMLTGGYVQPSSFISNMMSNIGVTYRNYLLEHQIYVIEHDDRTRKYSEMHQVQPVDPLFLRPDARGYEALENDWKARDLGTKTIRMKDKKGKRAVMRVRHSLMDPKFARTKDNKVIKERSSVIGNNNAHLILTRNGRQIGLVKHVNYPNKSFITGIQNNDRFWAIEVDFPAALDEEFNVPSNKQSAEPSDVIYAKLEAEGIPQLIDKMRRELDKRFAHYKDLSDKKRADANNRTSISERTLKAATDFDSQPTNNKDLLDALNEKREKVKKKAISDGKSEKEAEKESDNVGVDYELQFDSNTSTGAFYNVEWKDSTTILITINQDHAFYVYLFGHPDTRPSTRQGLELIIGALASSEAFAGPQMQGFYTNQRIDWSRRIENVLRIQHGENPADFEDQESMKEELAE